MARTYNDIYYNDDENSTAEILDDMKKLAESVDQQIGSIKSFNNDTSQFIEQVTPLMNTLSEQVIDMHQLADTMFTELEQVKEENKQLREDLNGLPERQASGESIDLNDSAEMRFSEFYVRGNSKQETREGYNLLNLTSLIGKTETKNGVTYKINEDCSITVNGTPTDYTSFNLLDMSLKAGTYKFVDGLNSNNVFLQTLGDFPRTSQNNTFSLAEDGKATVYLVILAGTPTLNNTTLYPMIYEGTEDKPYEQYGAMPSPDYPSEVECCGDNINLFDKDNANILNDYYLNSTANIGITSGSNQKILYIPVKKNTTYTVSKILSSRFRLFTYTGDINAKTMTNFKISDDATSLSISTGDDTTLYLMYTANDTNEQEILNSIKIVEGTETGGYSPYGLGCINEVICNKNLVNVGENSYSTMGLNITLDKSRIKINGTPTGNYYILTKDDINAIYLGKFKKGTYYMTRQKFSGFTKKGNGFSLQIRKDVWNGTVVANYGWETTLQQKKVILDEDVDLYLNMWANKDDIYNNVEFLFSIYSDTDINHVQHQEQSYTIPTQQPMRAIGDTRDTFIKKNNKWYEHHPIVRIESYNGETITSEYISNTGELSTGATVDYISDTPVDIECTEEQSTILDQIENEAKTYKNVTHIYSTDEISPVIDVTYKKDIETLFANTLVEGV